MQQNAEKMVKELYQAVDNKDVEYLAENLADDICFAIGNNPLMTNKAEILAANHQFFSSIESMSHDIKDVLCTPQEDVMLVATHGRVNYVRLDNSPHSAVFSTFLKFKNAKIIDYRVYADLSGL